MYICVSLSIIYVGLTSNMRYNDTVIHFLAINK